MDHSERVDFLEAAGDFEHDLEELSLRELAAADLVEERDGAELEQQAAHFPALSFCYFCLNEADGAHGRAVAQLGLNGLQLTSILASLSYMRESSLFCSRISLRA